MNLMRRGRAGYIVTGNFANKAYKEAAKYGEAVLLASSEDTNFDRIPNMADINARIAAEAAGDGLDYVYICQNNTIFGTMYHELPNCGDVPLVADVSSCFCRSRSTSNATDSSTPARRKTPAPRA